MVPERGWAENALPEESEHDPYWARLVLLLTLACWALPLTVVWLVWF